MRSLLRKQKTKNKKQNGTSVFAKFVEKRKREQSRRGSTVFCFLFSVFSFTSALCQSPPDVPNSHWAAQAVRETLANGILSVDSTQKFHGELPVTHTQAAIALAKLAQKLEARTWKPAKSIPLKVDAKAGRLGSHWQTQPLNRYQFALVLARIGDYTTNGIHPAARNSPDAGKSAALLLPPKITLSHANSAYASVVYLAKHRMLSADSPLLRPDAKPITAFQMRIALSQVIIGLNDRLSDLGHDKEGNTPDASFHRDKR